MHRVACTVALGLWSSCLFVAAIVAQDLDAWRPQVSPVEDDLHNAFFLDDQTGWVLAHRSGAVLHTRDGGATWTDQGFLTEGFRESIVFVDAETGWVAGEQGRIARTDDGGTTWEETGPGGEPLSFGALYIRDRDTGLALGSDAQALGAIAFTTTDGGRTWTAADASTAGLGFTDTLADLGNDVAIAGGFKAIHRTDDGGATWTSSPVEARAVRGLFFHDDQRGWAVGHAGFVARTDDGGRTWQPRPAFTRALLRSVLFIDDQRGFLVGDLGKRAGVLYVTEDGGARWRRSGGPYPGLHRLVRAENRVWIVGKDGTILSLDLTVVDAPAAAADDSAAEPGTDSAG